MKIEALNQVANYWRGLGPRERWMVGSAGAFVVLVLLYALLWAPLQSDLKRLRVDVPKAQEQVSWMRTEAARVKQLRAQAPTNLNAGSLLSFVEQSSVAFGLKQNIKRVEPDGANGVRVSLDGVVFNNLVNWIANLHKQGAVRVENATLEPQATSGIVNARLLLRSAAP